MAFTVVAGLKARHHLDMPGMRPETVYGPPLTTHCTTLDGGATVHLQRRAGVVATRRPVIPQLGWRAELRSVMVGAHNPC